MNFDADNKVIIETMNKDEAVAFIKFLRSEILRHKQDIIQANNLIVVVGLRFDVDVFERGKINF